MIAARSLTRRFGHRTAVEDVSFEVAAGELVALLGPNGAGKTTTMRMLAGLIAPTSGRIELAGIPLTKATGTSLRQRIGFLTEAPGLWDRLTVRENLTIHAGLYGRTAAEPRVDALLDTFGLLAHAYTRGAELSKGMRQKVALCRALLHHPDILLLDEPTSGLDPEVARTVRELIAERRANGAAILLSTHNLDEAERHADRVAVLHRRLVVVDTPEALRRRLATGTVVIRVASEAARWVGVLQAEGLEATAEGPLLTVALTDAAAETPAAVEALVRAGAAIVEVRPLLPALEDVYLHLVETRA